MKTQKMKYTAGVRMAIGLMTKLVFSQGKGVGLTKPGGRFINIPVPYWGRFDFFEAITFPRFDREALDGGQCRITRTVEFFWRGQKVAVVGLLGIVGNDGSEDDGSVRWLISRLEYQTVINLPNVRTEWFRLICDTPDEGLIALF